MSKAYLFYGTQLVDAFDHTTVTGPVSLSRLVKDAHGQEIYDGGWIYAPWEVHLPFEWWRCDLTPCHIDHVPKELRALALLIT